MNEQELDEIISGLSDLKSQKHIALEILGDAEYFGSRIMPAKFSITREQVVHILKTFNTSPLSEVILCVLRLIVKVISGTDKLNAERVEFLVAGGVYDAVGNVLDSTYKTKKTRTREIDYECLDFLLQVVRAGESYAVLLAESLMLSRIVYHIDSPYEKDTLASKALELLLKLSSYPRVRSLVYPFVSQSLIKFVEVPFDAQDETVDESCRILCLKVIRNLVVHSKDLKKDLVSEDIHSILRECIEKASTVALKKEVYDINAKAIQLFSQLHSIDTTGSSAKITVSIQEILRVAKSLNDDLITEYAFLAFRNYSKEKVIYLILIDQLDWLISRMATANDKMLKHILVIIQNILLENVRALGPWPKKILNAVFELSGIQTAEIVLTSKPELLYHCLCILNNLAMDDRLAQYMVVETDGTLISNLGTLAKMHDDDEIRHISLSCLRNLCIDEHACNLILQITIKDLLNLLNKGIPRFQTEIIQIIRNLMVCSKSSFIELYQNQYVLTEIILCIQSRVKDIQDCGLDILNFMMKHCSTKAYAQDLAENGVYRDLQQALKTSGKFNGNRLRELLSLVNLECNSAFKVEDPWKRLQESWDRRDALVGRAAAPKRKLKKRKARK
jgi:hypothetical protein